MARLLVVLVGSLCSVSPAVCQEQPLKVTTCQLQTDPAVYDHKLVEVMAFISHDAQGLTLLDLTCPAWPAVWLDYTAPKNKDSKADAVTEYKVEGTTTSLQANQQFRSLDALLHAGSQQSASPKATLVGRFFAKRLADHDGKAVWGGYGNQGCCTLLALQQVKSARLLLRHD